MAKQVAKAAPAKKAMSAMPTKKGSIPKPAQNTMQKTDSALFSDAMREKSQSRWTKAISSESASMAREKGVDSNKIKQVQSVLKSKTDSLDKSSKANMDALKKRPTSMSKRPTTMPTTAKKKK